jgi:hypothetical protein
MSEMVMESEMPRHWREIAADMRNEKDQERLAQLVRELDEALIAEHPKERKALRVGVNGGQDDRIKLLCARAAVANDAELTTILAELGALISERVIRARTPERSRCCETRNGRRDRRAD